MNRHILRIVPTISLAFIAAGTLAAPPAEQKKPEHKETPKATQPATKPAHTEPSKPAATHPTHQDAGAIPGLLSADSRFTTLTNAIQHAALASVIAGKGPYTLLAPTNEAFSTLPAGTLDNLLKPENKPALLALLQNHIIQGNLLAADISKLNGKTVKTLAGKELPVAVNGKAVTIGAVTLTQTDMHATNGVIHVVSGVIQSK